MSEEDKTKGAGEEFIRFPCEGCGGRVRIARIHAGKKVRCPKCKSMIVVPKAEQAGTGESESDSVRLGLDAAIFDIPQGADYLTHPEEIFDEGVQGVGKKSARGGTEKYRQRKLPWFIDIFLYPINVSGIIHLFIFILIPLLIKVFILSLLDYFMGVITLAVYLLFIGYVFYYLGYCVFDSSKGGCRAVDITNQKILGLGELFSHLFLMFGGIAVCFWPASVYYVFIERSDLIFWVLLVFGLFFFPMVLLRAVIFDSVNALNPILIASSISRTLLPYFGLVMAFCVPGVLVGIIIMNLPKPQVFSQLPVSYIQVLSYLLGTAYIYQKIGLVYLMMVAAHLLGRFYWRYKDKLGWGV